MFFRVPTRLTIEPGCFARLGEEARRLLPDSGSAGGPVMLVSDPGLAAAPVDSASGGGSSAGAGSGGWPAAARRLIEGAGFEVALFDRVEPNPRAATVAALALELRRRRCPLVVALGGGSVLDAAKGAAMLAANLEELEPDRLDAEEAVERAVALLVGLAGADRYRHRPLPMIALPTTCGTGSEVTWVSVISTGDRKISVKGESMFPDRALVDADLLATLPGRLVASTGLDALTHALEAITGRRANPASDALASEAVRLIFGHLRNAASEAASADERAAARVAMATASTLAGLAFGNADVGPVHCLSETLGGRYDLPHGLTNGILLAPMLRAHGASVERQLAALEPAVLGGAAGSDPSGSAPAAAAERVLAAVEQLTADLGLPGFAELDVQRSDHPAIAREAVANGSNPSSPRPMGEVEYLALLAALG